MKKHHLWGRKRPGPYTKLGNNLFDGTANAASALGTGVSEVTGTAFGAAASAGSSMLDGASRAGASMLDSAEDFNEWAQGLSDPETGIRPYTRHKDEKI